MKKILFILITFWLIIFSTNASDLVLNKGLKTYFISKGVNISKNFNTENLCLKEIKKTNSNYVIRGCFKDTTNNKYFYIFFKKNIENIIDNKIKESFVLSEKDKSDLDTLINKISLNTKKYNNKSDYDNYILIIDKKINILKNKYISNIYLYKKLDYLQINIGKLNFGETINNNENQNKIIVKSQNTKKNNTITDNSTTNITKKSDIIDCKYSNYDTNTIELYKNIFNECIDDNIYSSIINNQLLSIDDVGKKLACSEKGLNSITASAWRTSNNIDCNNLNKSNNYTYSWTKTEGDRCKTICKRNDGVTVVNPECGNKIPNLCTVDNDIANNNSTSGINKVDIKENSTSGINKVDIKNNYSLVFRPKEKVTLESYYDTRFSYSKCYNSDCPNNVNDRYISNENKAIKPVILKYTTYLQDYVSVKLDYGEFDDNIFKNKKTTLKVYKRMGFDYNKREWFSIYDKEPVLEIENYNGEEFKIYNDLLVKNKDQKYKLGVGYYIIDLIDNDIYDNRSKAYFKALSDTSNTRSFQFVQEQIKTGKEISLKNIEIVGDFFQFEYCNNGKINLGDNEWGRSRVDIDIYINEKDDSASKKSSLKIGECEKITYKISRFELNSNYTIDKNKTYEITAVILRPDDDEYNNILTKNLIIK